MDLKTTYSNTNVTRLKIILDWIVIRHETQQSTDMNGGGMNASLV